MCLFPSAQDAVDAGIALYGALPDFNRETNRLAAPFTLRGGAHTGPVVIDEAGRVSEMFSAALDITGHLQKQAEPDRFEISHETWNAISNADCFAATGREVDGVDVYRYSPE